MVKQNSAASPTALGTLIDRLLIDRAYLLMGPTFIPQNLNFPAHVSCWLTVRIYINVSGI